MGIQALQDSVLFTFVNRVKNGHFRNDTSWGFSLDNIVDNNAQVSRWGKVLQIGPDVTQIKEGDYILIEGAKWTTSIESDGVRMWRTKECFVQLTSDEEPELT